MAVSQPSMDFAGFLLSLLFALGCRWVKRNPSDFLRFTLFPFGGLNVDRWPRFMLLAVRLGGIAGFFAFVLSGLNSLYPTSPKDESSVALYAKFLISLAVAFFALRGSAEEIPERVSSKKAHPFMDPKPVSSTGRERLAAGTLDASASQPAGPSLVRCGSSSHSATSLSGVCSIGGCGQRPQKVRPLRDRARAGLGRGLFLARLDMAHDLLFSWLWSRSCSANLFVEICAGGNAPLLQRTIQGYNAARLRKEPVRCPHCSEYSQFTFGLLAPVDPAGPLGVVAKPFYRSPLYENSVWPNGCVLCGSPPTRFDEAEHLRFLYRRLAAPLAAFVVPHPAVRASGIPYCDQHRDAVRAIAPKEMFWSPSKYFRGFAERDAARREAYLLWRSLPMMRRHLAANKQARNAVSKGYRAPNLFQRVVTGPVRPPKL
jgi:hypothetical protein